MQTVAISFDDAISSGTFGPFRIGDSRDAVGDALGTPTDAEIVNRKRTACIWLYGEVEFHFDSDVLRLIHCDADNLFGGCSTLQLTSRKFRYRMSVHEARAILDGRQVQYSIASPPKSPELVLQLTSGYSLGFVMDSDAGMGPTGLRFWTLKTAG